MFISFMIVKIELRVSCMLDIQPYPQPPALILNVLTVRFLNPHCKPHWTTTVCLWPLCTGGCKLQLGAEVFSTSFMWQVGVGAWVRNHGCQLALTGAASGCH